MRALERRLGELTLALEAASDALALVDPVSLRYSYFNDSYARLLDTAPDALNAGGVMAALGRRGTTEDELRALHERLIARAPEGATTIERLWPDSDRIVESRVRAVRVQGEWMIVSAIREVTEHERAQATLRYLDAAINQSHEGLAVLDGETLDYLYVNDASAALWGLTREQLVQVGLGGLWRFGGADPETTRTRVRSAITAHPKTTGEMSRYEREAPDGRKIVQYVERSRRATLFDGRWIITVIARDVTQRETATQELRHNNEELARSNRDLELYARVTAHDLTEPLRMIGSYTQLLARRYAATFDEDAREFMGYVLEGTVRMKQLIDDLLAYSNAAKSRTSKPHPMDAGLDLALAEYRERIAAAGARVERPAALPRVKVDPGSLSTVFRALLDNALKFHGAAAPVIRIQVLESDGHCTVSVGDNGIGIERAFFDRIFIVFQRLHSRGEYSGNGIGLALCKKIVERHGGTIWVESEIGAGATFHFRLPIPQI